MAGEGTPDFFVTGATYREGMNENTTPPTDIFEHPERWFARFGISVTAVTDHPTCPICRTDGLDERIAA